MRLSEIAVDIAHGVRPFLKRIVPAPALRAAKRLLLGRIDAQIGKTRVAPYQPGLYPAGMNLIGPIDGATGLGQSLRLVERVVRQTGVEYGIYNYSPNCVNRVAADEYESRYISDFRYSVNLWHINLSEFAETFAHLGQKAFDGHYNIAFWLWELEEFPEEWVPYLNLLDEIWTPSEFISRSIRKKTEKPVCTIPYYVTAEADTERYGRACFGLPQDSFLFLTMYDALSVRERKNPEGAIRAFQQAFAASEPGVGLVVKANSADQNELSRLRTAIGAYRNIYVISRNYEKEQVNSLIACADAVVSLHRAEGFGLVLAEAMLNHVPVIATNWSANTEFMNPEVACMVGYTMKRLDRDIPPYKKGNFWAEPDVSEAARYMRLLAGNAEFHRRVSENAYAYVSEQLGMERSRALIRQRLDKILAG